MKAQFHLALPCLNLVETKMFYVDNIGASLGRYTQNWLDVDLFGNQITFTNVGAFYFSTPNYKFEGNILPSFHFGPLLDIDSFTKIYNRLSEKNLKVSVKTTFLKTKPGKHLSFFVTDPNDYKVEFKCFNNSSHVFKT